MINYINKIMIYPRTDFKNLNNLSQQFNLSNKILYYLNKNPKYNKIIYNYMKNQKINKHKIIFNNIKQIKKISLMIKCKTLIKLHQQI